MDCDDEFVDINALVVKISEEKDREFNTSKSECASILTKNINE